MEDTIVCSNCFVKIQNGEICPHCGFNNSIQNTDDALPVYTILQNRYIIGRVLASDSEGFTYIAFDNKNDIKVEIREFFPTQLSFRKNNKIFATKDNDIKFNNFYFEFVDFSKSLVNVSKLSAIINTIDVFDENNTSYTVCEYYSKISLYEYVEKMGGKLDYNQTKELFSPLMTELSNLHNLGIYHLGITPESLKVCTDGKMRLGDWSIHSVRTLGSGIDAILSKPYTAYEQYTKKLPKLEYTDIYSFASCMYFSLAGIELESVKERMETPKLLLSKDVVNSIPSSSLVALSNALQLNPKDRTSSFDSFVMEFYSEINTENIVEESDVVTDIPEYTVRKAKTDSHPKIWLVTSFVASALLLFFIFNSFVSSTGFSLDNIIDYFAGKMDAELDTFIKVPNMVGDYYIDWENSVANNINYKFVLEKEERFDEKVPTGKIISQIPLPDTNVKKNDTITLVVSLGSKERILPKITGIPMKEVIIMLEELGLSVEEVPSSSPDIPKGDAIWYAGELKTGDTVLYGDTVQVYVSTGK